MRTTAKRALWEAMDETGCAQSTLIVQDGKRGQLHQDGKTIEVIPAWDWLRSEQES